jgi:hypothetical protein
MAPWAMLKTSDALKIRANPRATREYMIPTISPVNSTSKKKAICYLLHVPLISA